MEKRNKIIYWVSTGLLSALILMSAITYFFNYEDVVVTFNSLGFPSHIIYPLAIAKILGVVAIWTRKSRLLKEWAYAGFFFNILLALSAHLIVSDGMWAIAAFALVLLIVSYYYQSKVYKEKIS